MGSDREGMPDHAQLAAALRDWLQSDADGQEILKQLAENPLLGSSLLLQRLSTKETPKLLSTAISGGQVGTIINIASAAAVNLSAPAVRMAPSYVQERLRLGWNCFTTATLMSAHTVNPEYEFPSSGSVMAMVQEVNDVFGVRVTPPFEPMPPRNFVGYFAARIEGKDPLGGCLFRLGGGLCLWWQFKGRHGNEIDAELWSAVESATAELSYILPGVADAVHQVLAPMKDARAEDDDAASMISRVVSAIVNPGFRG